MNIRDIILYSFEGLEDKRYLAVTGVKNRRKAFSAQDLDFFKNSIGMFASYYGINRLYENLESSVGLLESRESLINKMVTFGVVSINLTDETVNLYNEYFASIFNVDKFINPISLNDFYDRIKGRFENKNFADMIFQTYVQNRSATTIDNIEINLATGTVLSMKSNLFLTKNGKIMRILVFENIIETKNYIKSIEKSNSKLNILNDLSYRLSTVFTLKYALKTFAAGLYALKNEDGDTVSNIHLNVFDTAGKKTVTSLIYSNNEEITEEDQIPGKIIVNTNNISYEDYISNCKLLRNGKSREDIVEEDIVDDCEFKGADGSYCCFALKIIDKFVGTVSIDSKGVNFFDPEIKGLIKELINIASPVFANLILIETTKELAITDPLTGIYNRRYMYEFAKREIVKAYRNGTDLSVAILDIDRFKDLNDTYGHQIGDSMLIEFAIDLRNILMRKQDIITRYGGDEFVIILPDTNGKNGVVLMEKLRKYFKNKVYEFKDNNDNNVDVKITISVGVSAIDSADLNLKNLKQIRYDEDEILNLLLKIADANLYKAKESGRDKVIGSI